MGSNKLHIATVLPTNSVRLLFISKSALNYPERSGPTFRIFSPPPDARTTRFAGGVNPLCEDQGESEKASIITLFIPNRDLC